jgi:hypothetical protein
MQTERTQVDRLAGLVMELLRSGATADASSATRAELATALTRIGDELRQLAEDPAGSRPLAQLLRDVGAALGTPVETETDPERLAARLGELLDGFTGHESRAGDETQGRIRASAERAIAEALRKRGIEPLGSDGA